MKQRTEVFGGRRYAAGDAAKFGIVMGYKPTSRRYASSSPTSPTRTPS
jgi:hypothetical protein